MNKITITVPAQYERMINKILEMIEYEKPIDTNTRLLFARDNIRLATEWIGTTDEQKHDKLCRSVAHILLALESIEEGL
jgi:hypothetical protein